MDINMNQTRTIQQASYETGLSHDTLRYYERIGLITDVARAPNGHRRYTDADMVWISFLKQLRATGMPIQRMLHFAELRRGGDATAKERVAVLLEHRQQLEEQVASIRAFMVVIDTKIERHLNSLQANIGDSPHDTADDLD
jgi:DNA-binding transcriptional MerR regulator